MKTISLLAAVCGVALGFAEDAHADEGMWPFNHLPLASLQKKYAFQPTEAWLANVRRASVRVAG